MAVATREQLQAMINEGMKPREIAEELNINIKYIYKLMQRLGVEYNHASKYSEKQIQKMQELMNQGMTYEEVAREMKTTRDAISWIARRYHLKPAQVKRVPKLMQIRSQYFTSGLSVREIADNWGVSEAEMRHFMIENNIIKETPNYAFPTHKNTKDIRVGFFDNWFKTCAKCGKDIAVRDSATYAYKLHSNSNLAMYFCSWTCIQAYREAQKVEKERRKKAKHEAIVEA